MARNEHTLAATHVEGKLNVAADALSQDCLSVFCLQVPTAKAEPTKIPLELQELLVTNRLIWTSITHVEKAVDVFFSEGLASSTQRTY